MFRPRPGCMLALLLLSAFAAPAARAAWPTNGRQVVPSDASLYLAPTPDGNGGAFLTYSEVRMVNNIAHRQIFARHLKADGTMDAAFGSGGELLVSQDLSEPDNGFAVSDGLGGFFVVWEDSVDGASCRHRVARFTASGALVGGWPAGGVLLAKSGGFPNSEASFAASPDLAGGIYVLWEEQGETDVNLYGTHLGGNGTVNPGWGPAKPICTFAEDQTDLRALTDSDGNLYVAWRDNRSIAAVVAYAAHFTFDGALVGSWPVNGAPAYTNSFASCTGVNVAEADDHDLILTWLSQDGIHAQRLQAASGALAWGNAGDGMPVSVDPNPLAPKFPPILPYQNTHSSVFVAWGDGRNFSDSLKVFPFVQRLDASGAPTFALNGKRLNSSGGYVVLTAMVEDLHQGAIVAWADANGPTTNIYAQRVTDAGSFPYGASNGVEVCGSGACSPPLGLFDNEGGMLVFWKDERAGIDQPGSGFYAARVNEAGITGTAPVSVSNAMAEAIGGGVELRWSAFVQGVADFRVQRALHRDGPYAVVSPELRGETGERDFAWTDRATEPSTDYYYRIDYREGGGWLSLSPIRARTGPAAFAVRRVLPNPGPGFSQVEYELARAGRARLDILDLQGRRVRTLAQGNLPAGRGSARWDGQREDGGPAAAGVYFARLSVNGGHHQQKLLLVR